MRKTTELTPHDLFMDEVRAMRDEIIDRLNKSDGYTMAEVLMPQAAALNAIIECDDRSKSKMDGSGV